MWGCGDVGMWGCGDVRMWRCGDVRMWRCGGVAMWGCGGVAMWGCGDVAMWRCGGVAIFMLHCLPMLHRLPILHLLPILHPYGAFLWKILFVDVAPSTDIAPLRGFFVEDIVCRCCTVYRYCTFYRYYTPTGLFCYTDTSIGATRYKYCCYPIQKPPVYFCSKWGDLG